MPAFIKLNEAGTQRPININFTPVLYFQQLGAETTVVLANGAAFRVSETEAAISNELYAMAAER